MVNSSYGSADTKGENKAEYRIKKNMINFRTIATMNNRLINEHEIIKLMFAIFAFYNR